MRGLYCPAGSVRGQLKHSWLENQILNKTTGQIAELRRSGWPALLEEFPERLKQAQRLADEVEVGFSPTQLIDRLRPLRGLPQGERREIGAAVHAAYLERVDTEILREKLTAAAASLAQALARLRAEWETSAVASDARLQETWEEVLVEAARLVEVLDELPRGIVLP